MDFSLRWLLLLRITGRFWRTVLTVVAHRLKCPKACGVSGSGIEFLSPALVDGFFTTEPSGKHPSNSFTKTPWASIQQKASPRKQEDKWLSSSRWRELLFIVVFIMILSCLSFKYAAAAKSLQSCLTLCDPRDGSPPGFPVPGILQARTLEWVAISFSNAWKWKVKVKSLSRVQLLATPWTAAYQAPPPMGFSRQEYWSGLPLPSPSFKYRNLL